MRWITIDADSKLVLSYLCGGRDSEWACRFMEDLASRVFPRIQITTDGHRAYTEAVEGAFGMDVDYAMLIKLYGAPSDRPDTRYSPAEGIGIRTTGVLNGSPDPQHISTSSLNDRKLEFENGGSALYAAERVTPAMECGLANHVWTLGELVTLLEGNRGNAAA